MAAADWAECGQNHHADALGDELLENTRHDECVDHGTQVEYAPQQRLTVPPTNHSDVSGMLSVG